ncbi:MAG: aminodeoxychorismate synthase component I [Bacillota bacterium]
MRAEPYFKSITAVPDPAALFSALGGPEKDFAFLFESALVHNRLGRYSFMAVEPFMVLRSRGNQTELYREGVRESLRGNPFSILKKILLTYRVIPAEFPSELPPFYGGPAGYFAYDLGRQLERMPVLARDDLGLPEMYLGFYDLVVSVDHLTGAVYLCGLPLHGKKALAEKSSAWEARLIQNRSVDDPAGPAARQVCNQIPPLPALAEHFTKETYCAAVARAREYIAAGDIFEVNLSQRFSAPLKETGWELYRRLRKRNPAPFAAYLRFPEAEVVSASPERFLRVQEGHVETRPIKGTHPRGRTREEDERLRRELWESEKDRAELTMIIDLERNDLGRVCRVGSIKVPELYVLEEYATVFHLVSTVAGQLAPGKDVVDLLTAAFPGGSITGAPKIRAMEIIEELEPVRRGVYCGSIGWIGFQGDADLNIVIRTFIVKNGRAYFQTGGAVTGDSDPEKEYLETLVKARGLFAALNP